MWSTLGSFVDAGRLLVIDTDPAVGLTRAHIDVLRDFFASDDRG